jgi:hypothetical protein
MVRVGAYLLAACRERYRRVLCLVAIPAFSHPPLSETRYSVNIEAVIQNWRRAGHGNVARNAHRSEF